MDIVYRVTGEGPPLLVIYGAAEDADLLQPQAEAIAARGYQVITYDRRGTGAGSRQDWPDGGVAAHVADAAELIGHLGRGPLTVLGLSSGGVLALALVESHPELVSRVIAWETPALAILPDGLSMHAQMLEPMEQFLRTHPGDWSGAFDVMLMIMSGGAADLTAPSVERMRRNAEAAVRDDARHIVGHHLDPRPGLTDVVVTTGAGVDPLLEEVAGALAAGYGTTVTSVAAAYEHEIYLSEPDVLAELVAARLAAA